MKLIAVDKEGCPEKAIFKSSKFAQEFLLEIKRMNVDAEYFKPWVWYLAVTHNKCVGSCTFKTPPNNGRVEIAYITFPKNEGQGIATQMARQLIAIAGSEYPNICIVAQTLPEKSASTRVLEKLNFKHISELIHPEDGLVWEWELKNLSS